MTIFRSYHNRYLS